MTDTNKKKQVELQVFGTGVEVTYTGRLLGLLTFKEYDAIFVKPELKNKIITVETTPLKAIGEMDDIDGLRIAMTVKKRNDEIIQNKLLFISEPLEHVSSFISSSEVTFASAESYFIATEVDV